MCIPVMHTGKVPYKSELRVLLSHVKVIYNLTESIKLTCVCLYPNFVAAYTGRGAPYTQIFSVR